MKNNGSASLISKLEILSYLSLYYCLVRRVNVIPTLYSFIEELYRFDSIFTQGVFLSANPKTDF